MSEISSVAPYVERFRAAKTEANMRRVLESVPDDWRGEFIVHAQVDMEVTVQNQVVASNPVRWEPLVDAGASGTGVVVDQKFEDEALRLQRRLAVQETQERLLREYRQRWGY